MGSLCAIVPATDKRITLDRCVEAIRLAEASPDEIVVVDEPKGLSPAGARNEGARRTTAHILVFVDSDVEVHHDAFTRIRSAFAADPELAAVFGSYDDDPEGGSAVSDFRNLLHHHVHQSGAGPATTFWAGLGAVRRDAFAELGGFDEQRFPHPSIEDIELGMRLASRGFRILLDPEIQGKHLKRWTLTKMVQTDLFQRGIPWVQLLLERGSGSTELNLGWRHRLSLGATIVLTAALATGRRGAAGGSVVALLVLNRRFYVLLLRRRGWRVAAAGVPLHVVHQLVAAAAIPAGASRYLQGRVFGSRRSSP